MTFNPNTHNVRRVSGDEALAIVDSHRVAVDERFEVRPLADEFPTFANELGGRALDNVYLAEADNNKTGTFKWRGASVAVSMLKEAGVSSVVLASAGNHSLGGTWAAQQYNMKLDAFIPETASNAKKNGPRNMWPDESMLQIHIGGQNLKDAMDLAHNWMGSHPDSAFLSPYDDPNIIAGQGTLINDILQQQPDIQAIVSASGGGGLAAGILNRLEELGRTDIQYYAVEAVGSDSLSVSLEQGKVINSSNPNMRFQGSAVPGIGHHVLAICQRMNNLHTLTVPDQAVDDLIDSYQQDVRLPNITKEPTTLVGVAALPQVIQKHPSGLVAVISTGHNAELRP